eukprot:CAMPEP_0119120062 /NCGR_PEP_ID=MMETSP1310-20130426/1277_1 /TAXON_ID=464262 /ORGANISM="Genus nov. species nov., Strain RCC2339" /LENGTH=100 /DNA_ID=CAMNT_0007109525 /DNA_START=359 /DNA_END=659 /DNA_ORIENTATION=-
MSAPATVLLKQAGLAEDFVQEGHKDHEPDDAPEKLAVLLVLHHFREFPHHRPDDTPAAVHAAPHVIEQTVVFHCLPLNVECDLLEGSDAARHVLDALVVL